MLPKSLIKLGATAAAVTDFTADFPPPTLGARAPPPVPAAAHDDGAEASDDDASSAYDSDGSSSSSSSTSPTTPPSTDLVTSSGSPSSPSSPAASRDVHFLLAQLRSITSRLAALETMVAAPNAGGAAPPRRGPWYALGMGSRAPSSSPQRKLTGAGAAGASETGTALLGPGTLGALATLGSAAAAAVAVAAVAAWGKQRR